jgi:hypothetical protein
VARFIKACDPLAIGEWNAGSAEVRLAFADMLWSRAIEFSVEMRRWPDRQRPAMATPWLAPSVELDCQNCGEVVDAGVKEWLEYHAARESLGGALRDAQTH